MSRRARKHRAYAVTSPEASLVNVPILIPECLNDEAVVHDYMSVRGTGHNYAYRPQPGSQEAQFFGWGSGVRTGDILLITNIRKIGSPLRFQLERVSYYDESESAWEAYGVRLPDLPTEM